MRDLNLSTYLRALSRRYRQAEDAGFPDIFLIIIGAAGGLAAGGVVLLAYVPTHAVLLVTYALAIAAVLAVVLTVVVMINGEDPSAKSDEPADAPEKRAMTSRRP